ncbi:hypothetical protein BR93DRAFT_179343 [Coniochaeta sp. PMI_546]|nr:hypothetical protein BR93DRAFT_179343 [Coniochaeta sp. PMI_546]
MPSLTCMCVMWETRDIDLEPQVDVTACHRPNTGPHGNIHASLLGSASVERPKPSVPPYLVWQTDSRDGTVWVDVQRARSRQNLQACEDDCAFSWIQVTYSGSALCSVIGFSHVLKDKSAEQSQDPKTMTPARHATCSPSILRIRQRVICSSPHLLQGTISNTSNRSTAGNSAEIDRC